MPQKQFQRDPRSSPLRIDRVILADLHACEAYFIDGTGEPFVYDISKARGQVAFSTIRRWYFREKAVPTGDFDVVGCVESAIDEAARDGGTLGEYCAGLSPGERAGLVAEAVNIAYAFLETWPVNLAPRPLRSHHRMRTFLLDSRLELTYRVSFRFGQAYRDPSQGLVSAAVLLDVRPGRQYEEEERANRFLASLIDTLVSGVPPVRAVTWYAESQDVCVDEITEDELQSAAHRVGDGVRKLVTLDSRVREPERSEGWRCGHCRLLETCTEGQRYRNQRRY